MIKLKWVNLLILIKYRAGSAQPVKWSLRSKSSNIFKIHKSGITSNKIKTETQEWADDEDLDLDIL